MVSRVAFVVAVILALGAPPAAARPELASTRYGLITSTQGSLPDTVAEFIRQYDARRARYGAPIGIRLFSSGVLPLPGDGTMPGTLLEWAAQRHPNELITVSHKERDDRRLVLFLDWIQAHRLRASVIFIHEVQRAWFGAGGQPVAGAQPNRYRATYRAYRAIINAHPARSQVTLEKNLDWYWQRYNATTRGGDWRLYLEPRDPADLVSWDAYVFPGMPTAQGRYATPDEFFRYPRDVWRRYHLPWAVGEIGSAVQDGHGTGVERDWDPTGSLFASWVRRITAAAQAPHRIGATYVGMPPARFMKWWEGLDARDVDVSLAQVPAATSAYQALVQTHPL
jgi:hypothetical protein